MPIEQTFELALSKAMRFCAYQERCIKEVKQKLKKINVSKKDSDKILEILIEDNYLNQKRFTLSFVSTLTLSRISYNPVVIGNFCIVNLPKNIFLFLYTI